MTLNAETLLIIFVGVTALALVLQSTSVWAASRSLNRLLVRVEKQSRSVESEIQKLIEQLNHLSASLQPLSRISQDIQGSADDLAGRFDRRAEDLDHLVEELVAVARKQAAKIDSVVSDTVDKFEETTGVIQEDILRPVVEISSFVKGVRTGFGYIFSKKQARGKPAPESHSEEELFI